jgi:hypothetical protein
MSKILSALVAAVFAAASLTPAFAVEKKEQTTSADKKSENSKGDETKTAKSKANDKKATSDEKAGK